MEINLNLFSKKCKRKIHTFSYIIPIQAYMSHSSFRIKYFPPSQSKPSSLIWMIIESFHFRRKKILKKNTQIYFYVGPLHSYEWPIYPKLRFHTRPQAQFPYWPSSLVPILAPKPDFHTGPQARFSHWSPSPVSTLAPKPSFHIGPQTQFPHWPLSPNSTLASQTQFCTASSPVFSSL